MPNAGNIRLFSAAEKKKWARFCINLGHICKKQNWEKIYSKDINKKISRLSDANYKHLLTNLGITTNMTIYDLLADKKRAIVLCCYWGFSKQYRQSLARFFSLGGMRGASLSKEVFLRSVNLNEDDMLGVVLHHYWRKTAVFEREYQVREITDASVGLVRKKVRGLAGALSRGAFGQRKIKDRTYHFKESGKFLDSHIFWFLRAKSDEVEPSWPTNQRQKKFSNKMVVLDPLRKKVSLVVHNKKERRMILGFLQRLGLDFWMDSSDANVTKQQFGELFTSQNMSGVLPIVSVSFNKTNLPMSPVILIRDQHNGNSITEPLTTLKNDRIVDYSDISNISSFGVLFNGERIGIKLQINRLGYYRFYVPERSLTIQDRDLLFTKFANAAKIPLNKFFIFEGNEIKEKDAINSILNRKMISRSEEPPISRRILNVLYQIGLLDKQDKENKRYCVNDGCNKKYVDTWGKGLCHECGETMQLYGEYFKIKTNRQLKTNTIIDQLGAEGFRVSQGVRKFRGKKTHVIETCVSSGESVIVVPMNSTKLDDNLLEHLKFNDVPIVFVPYPYTSETDAVKSRGHGLVTMTDLVYEKIHASGTKLFTQEIRRCLDSNAQRISFNYTNALTRIEQKGADYDFHKFEEDVFSLIHSVFPSAQRLGDQFIGKRVSDGIAAVPLEAEKRFCITWDCKYSDSNYALKDPPRKIVKYLETLSSLPVVRTLGGLDAFIFISNNLTEKKFRRLAKKVKQKHKWPGRMVLLTDAQLITMCKHFCTIHQNLLSSPELNLKYYQNLAQLFRKPWRKIYAIKDDDIAALISQNYSAERIDIRRTEV